MGRNGTVLPIPDDPRVEELVAAWPQFQQAYRFPRSAWLGSLEYILQESYPQASRADLSVTARTYALTQQLFPLRGGPVA